MASSAKCLSLLLLTLLFSVQINARESQFFNKVPSNTNNNGVKETEVPSKEESLSTQEQEPSFIPQNENGYGLYGHESGQLPPATTTTGGAPYKTTTTNNNNNLPYKAESEVPFNKAGLPDNYNTVAYVTKPQGYTTPTNQNNYNYNGGNAYSHQPQGMSDTRFMDTRYTTPANQNKYNYNGGDAYSQQPQGMSDTRFMDRGYTTTTSTTGKNNNNNNYYNNPQKQGMSDTRFLENGKYYFELNTPKYNPNAYQNSRGFDSRNEYNNKGYYGNSYESSDEFNNSMEGYQNQDEFQDSQDEFMP